MSELRIVWKSLRSPVQPPDEVDDENVQRSFLSKVFRFTEGRNAYWGSWSSRSPSDSSFYFDENALKMYVERRRKQGSRFTFSELPALTLVTQSYDLLLFQTFGSAAFKKIPRDSILGKTAFEIARSICKHEFRIGAFIAPHGQAAHPTLPFRNFISSTQGTQYHLKWDLQPAKCDLASTMELVSDVTLHLNEV